MTRPSPATYAPVRDGEGSLAAARIDWLLGLVADEGARVTEPEEHFVGAFLDRHPDGVEPLLDRWRAMGPFTVEDTSPMAHKGWATLRDPAGNRHSLALTVDTSGKVRRAEIEPEALSKVPRDFADVDAVLDQVQGVQSTALVARKEADGTWTNLYERSAATPMPGGSVFKVYVLLAVAQSVEAGLARWDDRLEVRSDLRSLPTGEMQDLPDHTVATLYETAYNMFARSDNTASDMVIDHLGRDAVHRAVASSGHHQPALLDPFPSSRELFDIGWGPDRALLDAWSAGDSAQRRAVLEQVPGPLATRLTDLTTTAHQRGLDWFMSAHDVCRALDLLAAHATTDPTGQLEQIVSVYPGVRMDRDLWPRTVFKGGSTPGVVMFAWLLEDATGTRYSVVLQQRAERVGTLHDGLPLRRLGDVIIHRLLA